MTPKIVVFRRISIESCHCTEEYVIIVYTVSIRQDAMHSALYTLSIDSRKLECKTAKYERKRKTHFTITCRWASLIACVIHSSAFVLSGVRFFAVDNFVLFHIFLSVLVVAHSKSNFTSMSKPQSTIAIRQSTRHTECWQKNSMSCLLGLMHWTIWAQFFSDSVFFQFCCYV